MSKRIYHIALELGVPPRGFIRELAGAGLAVGNQMVIVNDDLEARIREVYRGLHAPAEPEPVAEAVAEPQAAIAEETAVPAEAAAPAVADEASVPAEEAAVPAEEAAVPAEAEGNGEVTGVETTAGDEGREAPSAEPARAGTPPTEAPARAAPKKAAPARTPPKKKAPARKSTIETGDAPAQRPAARKQEAIAEDDDARLHKAGTAPKPGDLVPTLDPRAGRLVKDAPVGGVPAAPQRGRGSPGGDTAGGSDRGGSSEDRAPGARRDGSRRRPSDRYSHKRGKETFHMRRRPMHRRKRPSAPKIRPEKIEVELPITVKQFAELSTYKAAEIIRLLFRNHKIMLTPNSTLDRDTVEILSIELEIEVQFVRKDTAEDTLLKKYEHEDAAEDLKPRPPVVTLLGHVDHGKTTLLDKIRNVDTASREAGGITQHVATMQVTLPDKRRVTFIDTPGHAAFTEMRMRGAQVTDVVILIVAGDDGVMPQTVEAISHIKAAGVPMVVAITKCDKEDAQPERVKQQLSEHEIYVEGYGGDVSVFEVSGITGLGVTELLEHLALMAEVDPEHFSANPDRLAVGTVIEAENSPQRGVVTTLLVQKGTLRKGDVVLAGDSYGSVRTMTDDKNQRLKEVGPGSPVEITGLDRPPEVGAFFYEVERSADAKVVAADRRKEARAAELAAQVKPTSVDALLGKIDESKTEEVNLVVKADVRGSLQPLERVLKDMATEEVRTRILHSGVGAVSESDIVLAGASDAFVVGFNVKADAKARTKAKELNVNWKTYKVIYDIEQDVRDIMEGRLAPELFEVVLGKAEVLAIFTFSKVGNIAGCRVKDGLLRRDAYVRVYRGEEMIHEGQLATLRREKDDAKEVKEGFECGLTLKNFDEFEQGDVIEAYVIESKKRTL